MQTENVPWQIARACTDHEGNVDADMYQALHTTIDLDGLYDILEMQEVHSSWRSAAHRNAKVGDS